jgi:hypothetical protein
MRCRCLALLLCAAMCGGCGEKSTDHLIADLKSPREKDRLIAVRLLSRRTGDPARIVPALVAALKDPEHDIRRSAALGLGAQGADAKEAIPALEAARADADARVREAARAALSRIDPEQFPPPSEKDGPKGG